MAIQGTDQNLILNAIDTEVRRRIENSVKEKIEEAKKELDSKIAEIVSGIAVDVMGMVKMETLQNEIVLTIRKGN